MFFKKKKKAMLDSNWQGIEFGDFLIRIPKDWTYGTTDRKIKARKGDEIQLTVSAWKMDRVEYKSLQGMLKTLQMAYVEIGYKPYSDVIDVDGVLSQTLALDGVPCCIIGAIEEECQGDLMILNFVVNTSTKEDLDKNSSEIKYILNNIATLVN